MFYIYLFIFWKNKYYSPRNSHFMIDKFNNEIIVKKEEYVVNNINILNKNTSELNNIQSYLKGDGSDQRCNKYEMDINTFLKNKKKLGILNNLLSNNTSIPDKLSVIQNYYNDKLENKYSSNLIAGGFFKDSDFSFF